MSAEKKTKLSGSWPSAEKDINFSNKTKQTDLALVVEGKKLFVSKLVLSLTSPVFDQMLNSNFKESNQNEIDLPDKKYADVLEFLKCVYPGVLEPVTMETVFDVLPLADEYLVQNLKKQCQQVLLANIRDKTISVAELCKYLQVASQYKLGEFQEECVKLAGNLSGSVFSAEADKFNLPIEIQAAIYKIICIKQSQKLSRQSELLRGIKSYVGGCTDCFYGKSLKAKIDAIPNQ